MFHEHWHTMRGREGGQNDRQNEIGGNLRETHLQVKWLHKTVLAKEREKEREREREQV